MYDIYSFNGFIADQIRTDAYVAALRAAVRPGCVVLDLGAGTGFFAILACKFGARKAYAIEYNDALQLGYEMARVNGCADRVEFIQELSTRVTLPELADVLICDLRGTMPWYGQGVSSVIDARRRFLRPGGTLIPLRDELSGVVVEAPDVYNKRVTSLHQTRFDVEQTPTRRFLVNTWFHAEVIPEQYLTEPESWTTLNYTSVTDPNPSGELNWSAQRDGLAHGISIWFRAFLGPEISFTTEPGKPPVVYGNPFFPFEQPIELRTGDTISVALRADLTGGDYVWSWETRVLGQGRPDRVKAHYRQSTFLGSIVSLERLRKRAAAYIPHRSGDGEIDRAILSLMDGRASLQEIAEEMTRRFPQRFTHWKEALAHAGELAAKYS